MPREDFQTVARFRGASADIFLSVIPNCYLAGIGGLRPTRSTWSCCVEFKDESGVSVTFNTVSQLTHLCLLYPLVHCLAAAVVVVSHSKLPCPLPWVCCPLTVTSLTTLAPLSDACLSPESPDHCTLRLFQTSMEGMVSTIESLKSEVERLREENQYLGCKF